MTNRRTGSKRNIAIGRVKHYPVRIISREQIPVRVVHHHLSPLSKALQVEVDRLRNVIRDIKPGQVATVQLPDVTGCNPKTVQQRVAYLVRRLIKVEKAPLQLEMHSDPVPAAYLVMPLDDQLRLPGKKRAITEMKRVRKVA